MEFLHQYRALLAEVSSHLWSREASGLAEILDTGEMRGNEAWRLFHEYREWGLIHLLVLSGARYPPFARAWAWMVAGIQRFIFGKSSYLFTRLTLWAASAAYLYAMRLPAPLLRCALSFFVLSLIPKNKFKWIAAVITFVAQWFFFEHTNPSTSFTLSWIAFVVIATLSQLKKPLLEAALITIVMQTVICYVRELPLTMRDLFIAVIANIICFGIFKNIVFPVIGFMSAAILLCLPALNLPIFSSIFKDLFVPSLSLAINLALLPVLVTHKAFRYTFSE